MSAPSSPPRFRVFAHTNVENAALYRAILRAFVDAKERFALHLRPRDVREALLGGGVEVGEATLDGALSSLAEWGNLVEEPDTAEVSTVEDFRKRRLLYRMSREGEAAERALDLFERHVHEPGELSSASLDDVREQLLELELLLRAPALDEEKVHRALDALRHRFEHLTEGAQRFMAGLMRAIDLHGLDEDGLLVYKERLIEYIEGFLKKLLITTPVIAGLVLRIEELELDAALRAVASREVRDRPDASPELEVELHAKWRRRWGGLRGWFEDRPGRPAQSTELRHRARQAIPALLRAVANLHDRRVQRSDRRGDLLTMARWFATAPHEADTHRLFRTAFGLGSARHLGVDEATLAAWEQAGVDARTSFAEAPPLRIAPRMRQTGTHTRRGRTRKVEDRSAGKALLRERAEREAFQLAEARARLASAGTCTLSELGALDRHAFELLLDLLAEALLRQSAPGAPVKAQSTDGSVAIELEPLPNAPPASIMTEDGVLVAPDCRVRFTDLLAPGAEREAAE